MATTVEIRSPYDGAVVGVAALAEPADVDAAVAAGRSFPTLSVAARTAILDRAAARLEAEVETFAALLSAEVAKPIRAARDEVRRAVSTLRFSAVEGRALTGESIPLAATEAGTGRIGFTIPVPIGVVGGITPFNFPLNLAAHKVGPAIAAGCPIVLKPADQAPLTALALRRLLVEDCELPPQLFHVLPGTAESVGIPLVGHPDVACISFTGSVPVGWDIRARAPRKKVLLELGNNSPVIVMPDVDVAGVARTLAGASFGYAGQSCISTQRILVHRSVIEAFTAALVAAAEALVVGPPGEETTDVSCVIDQRAADRITTWIDEAAAAGADVLCGAKRDGNTIWPTVIGNVPADTAVWREEVFGPVVGLRPFGGLDEAIAAANDTRFGLQASIFTNDLDAAWTAIEELRFGGVLVNEVPPWRVDNMPYGGIADSGNTKEGPRYAIQEMTDQRLVVIRR